MPTEQHVKSTLYNKYETIQSIRRNYFNFCIEWYAAVEFCSPWKQSTN